MIGIALCGYMGCGKSTIARILGELCSTPVQDLDQAIETSHGSIATIFSDAGEQAFRQIESETLSALLIQSGTILALGGGTVLDSANRQALRQAGYQTVYLQTPMWLLWSRVAGDTHRPLATERQEFVYRYRRRLPVYRRLDTMVSSYPGTPEQIARRVLHRCRYPNQTRRTT